MNPSASRLVRLVVTSLLALVFGQACDQPFLAYGSNARLSARPKADARTVARGRSQLDLGGTRDGVLQMPAAIPDGPIPLVVLLHGAGGSAERFRQRFGDTLDKAGVAALFLDSRGSTWDGIHGGFGPDVAFMDRALERVFDRVAVDPERLAIGGFSDGATYALALGLINGDLFHKIVAFSPGFLVDGELHGRPNIYMSHGVSDDILPIDRCSRVLAPMLRKRGYDVVLREFDGGHEVPLAVASEGFKWVSLVASSR